MAARAVHAGVLDVDSIAEVDGLGVTSLARTVIDLARTRPFEQAVAAADRALAHELPPAALDTELEQAGGYPSVNRAQGRLVRGSAKRVGRGVGQPGALGFGGRPVPTLQYEVTGAAGNLLGRADFAWPESGTLGEFDGRCKYGRLLRPGQDPADVVYAEKVREDLLRDLGWQVVRWTWGGDHGGSRFRRGSPPPRLRPRAVRTAGQGKPQPPRHRAPFAGQRTRCNGCVAQ